MTVSELKIRRAYIIDFSLITILLLISLLILVAFRRIPSAPTDVLSTSLDSSVITLFLCIWIGTGVVFSLRREPVQLVQPAQQSVDQHRTKTKAARAFRGMSICILLLIVTLAAFYVPMRRYFWTGNDETIAITGSSVWSDNGENVYSRPMVYSAVYLAMALTNNSVIGFLIFNLFLCYTSAVLIYSIVRMMLPRSTAIALLAALLYIVSPVEPARFYVMWMSPYPFQQFLLLLVIGLFAQSYLRGWRWMLMLCGLLLIITALINEAILPATLLGLFALLIVWRKHRHTLRAMLSTYLWVALETILGLRFALYYTNPARAVSYQSQFVARVHSIGDAVANLLMQVSATFNYIRFNANWSDYLDYSLLIGALALATLLIVVPRSEQRPPLKFTLIGFGLGVLAAILAVSAFVFEWHVWRTEFLALPFHAIAWAFGIALVGRLLPQRLYRPWLIAVPTLLITLSMSNVLAINEHSTYQWLPSAAPVSLYPAIQYDKVRSILQQVHHLAPAFTRETVVIFYIDSGSSTQATETPFGVGYGLRLLANISLGNVDAYQTNYNDFFGWTSKFTPDGFFSFNSGQVTFPYKQIVIFRVSQAGDTSLVEQIPQAWLPPSFDPIGYNPAARIIKDQQTPLPFFQ